MTATHDAEGATPDRNPDESDLIKDLRARGAISGDDTVAADLCQAHEAAIADHKLAHQLLFWAREVKRLGAEADAAFSAARAADARTDAARAEYLEARNTLRKMESEVAL